MISTAPGESLWRQPSTPASSACAISLRNRSGFSRRPQDDQRHNQHLVQPERLAPIDLGAAVRVVGYGLHLWLEHKGLLGKCLKTYAAGASAGGSCHRRITLDDIARSALFSFPTSIAPPTPNRRARGA
jgi:hypothetical protein